DADAVVANSQATATVKIGSGTTGTLTVPLAPPAGGLATSNIPITGANLTALQAGFHDAGYAGATVAYTAKAKLNGAVTTVDAISLDLTYYVPVLRGETGTCVDGTAPACTFLALSTTGNNKIVLYFQGTTYVPLGDIRITLSNFSAEVAKFGIVARQLTFDINNGNPRYTGPIFEIPDNSPGYGYSNTQAVLKVHLCQGKPTCSAADPVSLTSRVQLWDPSGAPVVATRQVSILSWSHFR
ncbi:MAG: hypothetical protein ACJ72D_26085, partial [Marmoricola sp.]